MDFILHESAALSKESCDEYIKLFEMNPQIQVDGSLNVQGKPLIDSESKKCKEIYLHEYRFFAPIQTCVSQGILKYKEKYSSIDELERWNVDSNPQYAEKLKNAVFSDLKRGISDNPSFYALIIHSNFSKVIF